MKRIVSFILALAVIFSLAGCSSAGGISTFSIGCSRIPSNLDPRLAVESEDLLVITNIYDGLFDMTEGGIEGNMVTGWSVSDDGLTYTLTLREDSVWHIRKERDYDGRPVTAEDFVFAFQRVCDPATKSPYMRMFSNIYNAEKVRNGADPSILGVSSPDSHTLVIRLEKADPSFLEKLCHTSCLPCCRDFFEKCRGAYGLSVPSILGNGPFRVNYLDRESGNATIVRVAEDKKAVQRIRIVKIRPEDMDRAYRDGTISGYFTSSAPADLSGSEMLFSTDVVSLVFSREDPFFANANVRQALAYYAYGFENSGANMKAVTPHTSIFPDTTVYSGKSLNSLIRTSVPSYMSDDPVRLMTQGTYEVGDRKPSEITLLIPSDSVYAPVFENINQLWQKDLQQYYKVENLPSREVSSRVRKGDFDIAFVIYTPSDETPFGVIDDALLSDEVVSELSARARSTFDEARAVRDISRCRDRIISMAYIVPMGSGRTHFTYSKVFSGVRADPFKGIIDLRYATVQ